MKARLGSARIPVSLALGGATPHPAPLTGSGHTHALSGAHARCVSGQHGRTLTGEAT
jgi:hypothetical protein